MSHDFDDKERMSERRSRRNPKVRKEEPEKELKTAGSRGRTAGTDRTDRIDRTGSGRKNGGLTLRQERNIARKKKIRRFIVMAIAECFALVAIFGYAYVARQLNKIQRPVFVKEDVKNNDLAVETVEKMKGYWTIAIFGVDARDNAIDKSTNSDVIIICNINQDTGEIKLVSVFRDSYLNISENGSYNKINQAYFVGGPQQAVAALNRNLDLNITDYMTFNWKAVAEGINVLGGVDIELSKAEFYYINSFITETVKATGIGSHQLTSAGMNHLDGVQAVAYGRLRLMDTDYARTERQRKVIAQAFEKAKQADFNTLRVLIGTVFPHVATNIGVDDLVQNASSIAKYHLSDTTGFPQARGDANMGKKGAVVVPQTLESNVVKLHEFLFGDEAYTPSDTVKKISAKIAADTGMYKEGNYVDRVSTDGGVIQTPKATKAASRTTEAETSESRKETDSSTERETDEDGKPIKKETETDEDGNPLETTADRRPGSTTEAETDEDGNPLETTNRRPGSTTEAETDEDGNPLESSSGLRPVSPTDSSSDLRPGGTGTTAHGTTGTSGSETDESESASRPGGTSNVPGTGNVSGSGAAPGTSTTPGTSGVSAGPGSSTSPGTSTTPGGNSSNGTSTTPGGSTGTGTTPGSTGTSGTGTAPGSNSGSGTTTAPGTSAVPGGGTSGTDNGPSGAVQSGPVAGPGQ